MKNTKKQRIIKRLARALAVIGNEIVISKFTGENDS